MRILLVEDDEVIRRLYLLALEAHGFVVECASCILEATEVLEAGDFNAILLDRRLPDGDGLALCRARRALGDRTRFVICSGLVATNEIVEGYGAGAELYLKKPMSPAELAAHVSAFVARGRVVLGAVVFDRSSGTLTVGPAVSALAPQERIFLEELVDAAGLPVGRDQLALAIWHGNEPDGNGLEVLAHRLRRKLGEHAVLLKVVRGLGYRIVLERRTASTRPCSRSAVPGLVLGARRTA